jgi:hypothetical protein
MKSQDILLLLKLISLHRAEKMEYRVKSNQDSLVGALEVSRWELVKEADPLSEWEGWDVEEFINTDRNLNRSFKDKFSVRGLACSTGISKTEVANSLERSINVGLAVIDRNTLVPRANQKALFKFLEYGIKYVFPAIKGPNTRGIPTSFAAPVMLGRLMTAGNSIYVWPDAHGKQYGQSIEPLFKSVPHAVKQDPLMYKLLALIDAIRIGSAREVHNALEILESLLK